MFLHNSNLMKHLIKTFIASGLSHADTMDATNLTTTYCAWMWSRLWSEATKKKYLVSSNPVNGFWECVIYESTGVVPSGVRTILAGPAHVHNCTVSADITACSKMYQGIILQGEEGNCVCSKFKPRLKIVTVPTMNIGAKAAKVAKYSNNYNRIWILQGYIGVACPLLFGVYKPLVVHSSLY